MFEKGRISYSTLYLKCVQMNFSITPYSGDGPKDLDQEYLDKSFSNT